MKESNFKTQSRKVTAEERAAGILFKHHQLAGGWWLCTIIAELVKLDRHQRGVRKPHEAKIRADFNPLYAKPLLCTCRADGQFDGLVVYVEDGQHTHGAWLRQENFPVRTLDNGQRVVDALVHFDLTKEKAALVFKMHNTGSVKASGWDTMKAGMFGECPTETCIMELAEQLRLSTPITMDDDGGKSELRHPKEYVNIVEHNSRIYGSPEKFSFKGKKVLERIFKIHARCFKGQQTSTSKVDVSLVRGLAQFILRNPHITLTEYYAELNYEGILVELKQEAIKVKDKRNSNKRGVDQIDYRTVLENIFSHRIKRKAA